MVDESYRWSDKYRGGKRKTLYEDNIDTRYKEGYGVYEGPCPDLFDAYQECQRTQRTKTECQSIWTKLVLGIAEERCLEEKDEMNQCLNATGDVQKCQDRVQNFFQCGRSIFDKFSDVEGSARKKEEDRRGRVTEVIEDTCEDLWELYATNQCWVVYDNELVRQRMGLKPFLRKGEHDAVEGTQFSNRIFEELFKNIQVSDDPWKNGCKRTANELLACAGMRACRPVWGMYMRKCLHMFPRTQAFQVCPMVILNQKATEAPFINQCFNQVYYTMSIGKPGFIFKKNQTKEDTMKYFNANPPTEETFLKQSKTLDIRDGRHGGLRNT